MFRTALGFLQRDFLITISYKFSFVIDICAILFLVGVLYFGSQFVNRGSLPLLEKYGGNYFSFILIGLAFKDYVEMGLKGFADSLREGQLTGTLEIMLLSPTKLSILLGYSSLWGFLFTTFRISLYVFFSWFIFDLRLPQANMGSALVIFLLSLICFILVGSLLASLYLVVKRGESAINLAKAVAFIMSGLFFPREVFPTWLIRISDLFPMTYSLHGLRMSLIQGASLFDIRQDVIGLTVFIILLFPLSVFFFRWSLRTVKMNGTLTQF